MIPYWLHNYLVFGSRIELRGEISRDISRSEARHVEHCQTLEATSWKLIMGENGQERRRSEK